MLELVGTHPSARGMVWIIFVLFWCNLSLSGLHLSPSYFFLLILSSFPSWWCCIQGLLQLKTYFQTGSSLIYCRQQQLPGNHVDRSISSWFAAQCVSWCDELPFRPGLSSHTLNFSAFQRSLMAECHALLSGNLKLNLIASPVTVFKRSFRQVNGISAERSALDVQSVSDNRNELWVKCD